MPQIVLDGTGKPKSDIVEGAYELCGLNGFEFDRTPEEMTTGLRMLNDLMSELAADGLDFGYDFPTYGNGLLEEPSGLPDSVIATIKKLLAQLLCPALGATFGEDARASLNRSWFSLRGRMAPAPPSMKPAYLMKTNASRRRRGGCLGFGMGSTTETTPVVVPPVTPVPTPDPDPDPVVTLAALLLSASTVAEGAAPGTVIGTLSGMTAGSTLSLSNDAGGRFALSGNTIVTGLVATDYEAASFHNIEVTETLAGAIGSPKPTGFTVTVTNTLEVTLAALGGTFTLPEDATAGTVSGTLTGKTAGSTLSLLNDAGGKVALSGSNVVRGASALDYETATSHSFTVRETHPDATNSPRDTILTLNVTDVADTSLLSTLTPPTLSLASGPTTYPPQINFDFTDAAAISGDTLAVRKSGTYPVPGGSTTARVLLTDTIISTGAFTFAANSDTPNFLSSITSPAQTFFNAFIERGTSFGPTSNTIKHGDATAPTMVTTSPTTKAENQSTIADLVVSEPVTVVSISGTDGALLKVAETSASTTLTVQRVDGTNANYENKASYSYTLNVADLAGNTAALPMVSNISDQDEVPDTTTFAPQTSAVANTHYQRTYTVAGLATGVSIQVLSSGTGVTWAKGAGALGTTPVSVVNGDVVTVDVQASATSGVARSAVLHGGEPDTTIGTFTVTTAGVSAALDATINTAHFTYTNTNRSVTADGTANLSALSLAAKSDARYVEFGLDTITGAWGVGIAGQSVDVTSWPGGQAQSTQYASTGNIWHNSSNVGPSGANSLTPPTAGGRVKMAFNSTTVWFGVVGGAWQTGTPGVSGGLSLTGLTAPFRAMLNPSTFNDKITLYATAATQLDAAPAGFTALAD